MRIARYILTLSLAVISLSANNFAVSVEAAIKEDLPNLRWRAPVIRLGISSSLLRANTNIKAGSDILGTVRRSLAAWSDVADVEFVLFDSERQSISPSGVTGDGVSLLTIAQTPENVLLFSKNPDVESARTRVFYNRAGTISEADIVLNPFMQFSTDGTFGTVDLESTLTHEFGHLLGIRHSGVIGSIMSESLARNNELTFLDGPRKLSASDMATARQLYGASKALDCCASISGKLVLEGVRAGQRLSVWAEENGTGRVMSWVETTADGSFEMGGLSAGSYSVLWRWSDGKSSSTVGQLGTVKLAAGEIHTIGERLSSASAAAAIFLIGANSQLSDAALTLGGGREHTVFLGGIAVDKGHVGIEFNSPYLTVSPGSLRSHDFGDEVSVISFVVRISPETPRGSYSVYATNDDGIQASLIGGIIVR